MKPHLRPIMLAGTGSDVGKSLIATGLCRIFLQDGYSPVPFKAQNMALNSFATPDGLEIGRAQAVQAEAAGIPCSTDMNPILLKPTGNHTSQVVLNGRPIGNRPASAYFRAEGRDELRAEVGAAFRRLAEKFNPVVMEGAGSIAEINLRDCDIVNMSMAVQADASVILVADIDRGGVFASAYGSIMLQPEEDRKRIKGIIVNKFRGDLTLFEKGRKMMEEICGVPVLGVVPFAPHIHIDEEDSVALASKARHAAADGRVNIAVVLLPHISNFTDFNRLERDPRVNLFYTDNAAEILRADIVILPGTKSTLADLQTIRDNGVADAVIRAAGEGRSVIGICGGYQMLGNSVSDPDGVEGEAKTVDGLGLLPVSTILSPEKITRRTSFRFKDSDETCNGYEIHMGRTDGLVNSPNRLPDGTPEGCSAGNVTGTYMHGFLDNTPVVEYYLAPFCSESRPFDYAAWRQEQFDLLAEHLRQYIDIPQLYKIMQSDD